MVYHMSQTAPAEQLCAALNGLWIVLWPGASDSCSLCKSSTWTNSGAAATYGSGISGKTIRSELPWRSSKRAGVSSPGVARLHDAVLLWSAGTDVVVTSLDEITIDELAAGRLSRRAA